jgi:hypothetical protein
MYRTGTQAHVRENVNVLSIDARAMHMFMRDHPHLEFGHLRRLLPQIVIKIQDIEQVAEKLQLSRATIFDWRRRWTYAWAGVSTRWNRCTNVYRDPLHAICEAVWAIAWTFYHRQALNMFQLLQRECDGYYYARLKYQ